MPITTSDQATESNVQHKKPCGDCPWRRNAIPGWLGNMTPEEWLQAANGDGVIDCHTVVGSPQPQCAGAASYRANTCKSPRDLRALRLPVDRTRVFSSPSEFLNHHKRLKRGR